MPRTWADLRPLQVSPDFRRLLWGLGVSNFGTQLTVVAVGLQVYAITGSTLSVGVLGLCALIPLIALGLYGGALVDAYDRRTVALASSLLLMCVTLALALQAWLGVESVLLLYALVAVQSAGFAVNNPARTAIVPRLIDAALLPAANVLNTIVWNISLTVGPLVGAALVATWGFEAAYTVDAALFVASLWALWRLPKLPPLLGDASPVSSMRGLSSVVEGLRYLTTQSNVRMTFVVDLIAMVLAMPRVLFPAAGVLFLGGGETTTGLLSASFAAGAVLFSVLSGRLTTIAHQGRVIVVSIAVFGFSVAGFGAVLVGAGGHSPTTVLIGALVPAMILLALAGGADAISAVFRQTILQSATPDHLRGRLQGVFIVVVAGGPRLGDLVLGAESSWLGEGGAALLGGITCVLVLILVTLVQRRFLSYDARHPEP